MELCEFFKFLKWNTRPILVWGAGFLVVGLGLTFWWPVQFKVTGHLFVGREIDVIEASEVSNNYFDYEGYYAQQTAQNYTPTAIAFLQSVDVLNLALEDVGIELSETVLQQAKRAVSLRQVGPQLIEVGVKYPDAEQARQFWESLVEVGLRRWSELEGTVVVVPVTAMPVMTQRELPISLVGAVSLLMGLAVGGLVVGGKEYFG